MWTASFRRPMRIWRSILVDDGSPDQCPAICDAVCQAGCPHQSGNPQEKWRTYFGMESRRVRHADWRIGLALWTAMTGLSRICMSGCMRPLKRHSRRICPWQVWSLITKIRTIRLAERATGWTQEYLRVQQSWHALFPVLIK